MAAIDPAVIGTELPGAHAGDTLTLAPKITDVFAKRGGADDVFAHGMLSMAYLGRLLTNWVPQSRIRAFAVRFAGITPVHARPTCTGRVVSLDQVGGERRAGLELAVTLADGTVTLTGTATVALP